MTALYKYRLRCETESSWVYTWAEGDTAPTACPNDTAHTIDTEQTSVVQIIDGSISVEELKTNPKTPDGKLIQRASAYTIGTRLYPTSRGDDRSLGRGKGPRLEFERSIAGESDWLEIYFNDGIELGGGEITYKDAAYGDWICMRLYAPASQPVATTPGTGNCVISDHVIVPYATGTHDIDLVTIDKAVPLPAENNDGFWNWECPCTGGGEITPAPSQDGGYHLLDIPKEIHTYVHEVGLLGNGQHNFTYPDIDPTKIPPQWRIAARIHHAGGANTLQVSSFIVCSRSNGEVVHT
jgi:hypothetical protein